MSKDNVTKDNVTKFCDTLGKDSYNGGNIGIYVNPNSEFGKKITKYAKTHNISYSIATEKYIALKYPGNKGWKWIFYLKNLKMLKALKLLVEVAHCCVVRKLIIAPANLTRLLSIYPKEMEI